MGRQKLLSYCAILVAAMDWRVVACGSHGVGEIPDQLGQWGGQQASDLPARRALKLRSVRANPYGARYSKAEDAAASAHRELAEGTTTSADALKERRRKERRKALARKSKVLSREDGESASYDSERPVGKEQQYKDQSVITDPSLDSDALVGDSPTTVSKVGQKRSHAVMKPRRKGSSSRARPDVEYEDTSGTSATGMDGEAVGDDTEGDLASPETTKSSKAGGLDSAGAAAHIAEEVGQDVLEKSGSSLQLESTGWLPRDASHRGVAAGMSGGSYARDGAALDQDAVEGAVEATSAEPRSKRKDSDSEVSSAGVMPEDWGTAGSGESAVASQKEQDSAADLLQALDDLES